MTTDPTPRTSTDVDAFLAPFPEDVRTALQALRRAIAAAAPDAVELINYGVPAFKYRGRPLVSFGATKNGACSFYVQSPAVMEAYRDVLAAYDTSKGTIRFAPSERLPVDLVTKLVHARMAETDRPRT